jgi:flagellar basal-body rod modification protein FlgD
MDVSAINSTSSTSATTATQAMGKDQFMKLLVAQLQNQDPLNPLDDKEFVAQLAQFSSLEQLTLVNDNLGSMQTTEGTLVNAQLVGLIGREVLVAGNTVHCDQGTTPHPLRFDLEQAAEQVTVSITDGRGTAVRCLTLGSCAAGTQSAGWDGLGDDGEPLPSGDYTVTVNATDANGAPISAQTFVQSRVTGVTFESGSAELLLESGRTSPAAVLQVLDAADAT